MVTVDTSVLNTFKREIVIMAREMSNLKEKITYLKQVFD